MFTMKLHMNLEKLGIKEGFNIVRSKMEGGLDDTCILFHMESDGLIQYPLVLTSHKWRVLVEQSKLNKHRRLPAKNLNTAVTSFGNSAEERIAPSITTKRGEEVSIRQGSNGHVYIQVEYKNNTSYSLVTNLDCLSEYKPVEVDSRRITFEMNLNDFISYQ